jgi:hypothetical protein
MRRSRRCCVAWEWLPTCFRREERKSLAPMSSNREALALWRLALQLVEAKGVRSENCDGVVTLICRTDTLTIAFTPSRDERPNGLDVWRRHGDGTGRKVLDVIWADGTIPVVASYHGGGWEWTLKRARF